MHIQFFSQCYILFFMRCFYTYKKANSCFTLFRWNNNSIYFRNIPTVQNWKYGSVMLLKLRRHNSYLAKKKKRGGIKVKTSYTELS